MNLALLTILLISSACIVDAAPAHKLYTWGDILVRTPDGEVVPIRENDIAALYDAVQVEKMGKSPQICPHFSNNSKPTNCARYEETKNTPQMIKYSELTRPQARSTVAGVVQ